VKGTCKKEECPFFKEHGKKCPFFVETWWKEGDSGKTELIEDCAPVRAMLMQQDFHGRMVGVQQAVEEQRNKVNDLDSSFKTVLEQTREYIKYQLREQSKNMIQSKNSLRQRVIGWMGVEK